MRGLRQCLPMRDEVSAVMVELRGAEMATPTGKRVQASGKVLTSEGAAVPADQVVHAAQVKMLERGCSATTRPAGSGSRARLLKWCAPLGQCPGRVLQHTAP